MKRSFKHEQITHKKVLSELRFQISELTDIRTESGHSSDVMTKTIVPVCRLKAFEMVYRNPHGELQALNSALRLCALKADRVASRSNPEHSGQPPSYDTCSTLTSTAEELVESLLVDRK